MAYLGAIVNQKGCPMVHRIKGKTDIVAFRGTFSNQKARFYAKKFRALIKG